MIAQAHIDSNTCGSHGSSEQQQYICLGDRSALWGVSGLSLSVHFYVWIHVCPLMQQVYPYIPRHAYIGLYCIVSPALWGVIHIYYTYSSSISYMLTVACCGCIGSKKSKQIYSAKTKYINIVIYITMQSL